LTAAVAYDLQFQQNSGEKPWQAEYEQDLQHEDQYPAVSTPPYPLFLEKL
jgi:hypothetical protein